MGELDVRDARDTTRLRSFVRAVLEDLQALEQMLADGVFEQGVRRVGAEQELFLVDRSCHAAPYAARAMRRLGKDGPWTHELALFNLEANLEPRVFGGSALRDIEAEIHARIAELREALRRGGGNAWLGGILPTLRREDLRIDNMTPLERYRALNEVLRRMRGDKFRVVIKGVDELHFVHDNVLLEACNTSCQFHFQVAPQEFAPLYNIAQLVTAPVLAVAVNSPLLLGRRLWKETRIALFQHSVDARSDLRHARGQRPRVHFGDAWLRESVLEIFRDDVARYRAILTAATGERPLEVLRAGGVPSLRALRVFNGTIYRWNRACYGVRDGVPHLRIEVRALPAGPTVVDEVANAAFLFGLMAALSDEYADVADRMPFEHVKENFLAAARRGLDAQFTWVDGLSYTASELVLDKLLPRAEQGLASRGVDPEDISKYLGIIEERASSRMTGARWMLASLEGMGGRGTLDERMRALVRSSLEQQEANLPVHKWPLAKLPSVQARGWQASYRVVDQYMITDLVTVRPEDAIELAASLMDWEKLRYLPVEDDDGRLAGLVSYRAMIKLIARGAHAAPAPPQAVKDIMRRDVISVPLGTPTTDAIRLMRERGVGCLPVLDEEGRLVGIVTERELLRVAGWLLERQLDRGKRSSRPAG